MIRKKANITGFIALCLLSIFFWYNQKSDTIALKSIAFEQLPGWNKAKLHSSFAAFQISCKTFLRQNPNNNVGTEYFPLKAKDWQPVCLAAQSLNPINEDSIRSFFIKWFQPIEFQRKNPLHGLFTGYYLPLLQGSMVKTAEFNVPIYGLPNNLVTIDLNKFSDLLPAQRLVGKIEKGKLMPYPTRAAINKGAIEQHAPVLLWVNSHIDRLFLEIQGSGIVELPNKTRVFLGYAGENGAPYTAIGQVLMQKGLLSKEKISMQNIKTYLEAHPDEIIPIINHNQSFIFFRFLKQTAALGAQGVDLTPGYSLAVDRKWIPLGIPLWLDTTHPSQDDTQPQPLQRLMIAQDTGGAIRGPVRGDVFWGAGKKATFIAGKMKNEGHYWIFVPKTLTSKKSAGPTLVANR